MKHIHAELTRKIHALLAFTPENSTAHEVANAQRILQKLLTKHQITLQDIGQRDPITDIPFHTASKIPTHVITLSAVIADAFHCTVIITTSKQRTTSFLGHESNVEVALYFYETLHAALLEQCSEDIDYYAIQPRHRSAFRNAYILGAAFEIDRRLQESQHDASPAERAIVATYSAELHDRLSNIPAAPRLGLRNSHDTGLASGRAAGENIPLTRGIPRERAPKTLR